MSEASTAPSGKRILVLGATGMAGHMVATYLGEQSHTVVGLARSPAPGVDAVTLDVLAFDEFRDYVLQGRFDAVVNCVGMLVGGSEEAPGTAVLVNSFLPHLPGRRPGNERHASDSPQHRLRLPGRQRAVCRTRRRDGQSFYDRSKGLGEIENTKDLTLRMSIIGPEIRPRGSGLMHWFLGESGSVNGYVNAIWNGITTLELSKAIDRIISSELTGIYHLVPDYSISKFDLLGEIADVFGRSDLAVVPDASISVDKTLLDTRGDLGFHIGEGGYRSMLDELKDWILDHPELYSRDSRYAVGDSTGEVQS